MTCIWCGTESGCDCVERLVCDKAGQTGHAACGWCTVHAGPKWQCLDRCAHWPTATLVRDEQAQNWSVIRDRDAVSWNGSTPRRAWDLFIGSYGVVRPRSDDNETKRLLLPDPIALKLACPICREPHIDEGEFATRVHKTHQCQRCKWEWRPTEVPTVGVA